jgi:hypothetical protein
MFPNGPARNTQLVTWAPGYDLRVDNIEFAEGHGL